MKPVTYRVVLIESEEGVAIFCPAMPGCVSQGITEVDALENIREAIALWLDCGGIMAKDGGTAEEAELLQEAAAEALKVNVREVGLPVAA